MKLFATIYNDARLLPHFLRHYAAIGVTHFFFAVAQDLRAEVERGVGGYETTLHYDLDVADSLLAGTAAVSAMRRKHQGPQEWVVIVDLDEFIEGADLRAVVDEAERAGVTVVRGIMHDRFSVDGLPQAVPPDSELSEIFPIKSRFIRNVMKASDHKGVLVKGPLQGPPLAAHHRFVGERLSSRELEISHYKWIAGSIERLRRSYQIVRTAGQAWAVEYQRALEHFDRHGRFAWQTFGGAEKERFTPEPPAAICVDCGGAISDAEKEYSVAHCGRPLCRTDQARRGFATHP